MRSPPAEAPDWLDKAKEARRAAELLTDAEAKEVMLELSLFYLGEASNRGVRRAALQ